MSSEIDGKPSADRAAAARTAAELPSAAAGPGRDATGHLTGLLHGWLDGESEARDELWGLVYAHLKSLAHRILEDRGQKRSLRTSDLVHETYLKLQDNPALDLSDRRHFFAVAARAMRFILVDHARRAFAERHGGGQAPLPLDETIAIGVKLDVDLLALDQALEHLKTLDARKHDAVELAYFGGLTYAEVGESLQVSPATVKRELKSARIWLLGRLQQSAPA